MRRVSGGVRAGMLEDVANTKIPSKEQGDILAFVAKPNPIDNAKLPVVILIHEFYGLTPEICGYSHNNQCAHCFSSRFRV